MISFKRSNTPYSSIFPFNANRFAAPAPAPAPKVVTRTPGTRKPRVISKRIYGSSKNNTAPTNVVEVAHAVQGFAHLFR